MECKFFEFVLELIKIWDMCKGNKTNIKENSPN